jgi:hypothetical protein
MGSKIPDAETRARHIANLQAACKKLDEFGELLDRSIAMVDEQIAMQLKQQPYKKATASKAMANNS